MSNSIDLSVRIEGQQDTLDALDRLKDRLKGTPRARVYTRLDYAEFVEFGTGPHPITPDDADALHFEVGGDDVFAQRVMHPGTSPQPFMRPAAFRTQATLPYIVRDAYDLQDAVERAADQLQTTAKRRAPVDTGRLRSSINVDIE